VSTDTGVRVVEQGHRTATIEVFARASTGATDKRGETAAAPSNQACNDRVQLPSRWLTVYPLSVDVGRSKTSCIG